MGKKTKLGKDRRDKFYKLAKETGFRSRAAFKLIQLNRRFGFLQQSQVCVDLCAAPGGWMQVAKQNMPVSSIVVGIDLFPIKPVPGCISLTEDITTDKCRQNLAKELKTWKADVILNDGAPNVGKNWLFDAYQQICLSLSAVKLSTEFLRPGGWFVTKVFRSKDYNAFIWVLKQLFKKVYATKPSASRKESAEIFIVCQGYKAPSKIDPRFMDPKYVFEELEIEPKNKIDLLKDTKLKKAKAVGYESVDLRRAIPVSEFLQAESALDVLQKATEFQFDNPKIENHPNTTSEIKECFKDIKVLGRKDLKDIIKWWKVLKEEFYPSAKPEEEAEPEKKDLTPEEQEEAELEEMDKYIEEMKLEEQREEKRKKKRANKERSKLEQKLALKMVIKGDAGPQETLDDEVFNLNAIKNKKVLQKLIDEAPVTLKKHKEKKSKDKFVEYDEDELHDDEANIPTMGSEDEFESEDEIVEELGIGGNSSDEDDDDDDEAANWSLKTAPKNGVAKRETKAVANGEPVERNRNPLITDLDYRDKDSKRIQKAELWFAKDAFKEIDTKNNEVSEDIDLDGMVKNYKKKGIKVVGEEPKEKIPKPEVDLSVLGKKARRRSRHGEASKGDIESSESDDSDDERPTQEESDDNENKDINREPRKKRVRLNEEELALGQLIVQSKKMKRDVIDGSWNRYMYNDENLPDWFMEDEQRAMKRDIPVPSEFITDYRKNLQEFNTRSIKKVMEAKARKKRQGKKQMEKVKKKAETILENVDHSGQEKIKMLKKLYKKTEKKKEEITYVVSKKTGVAGKKVRRPAGVKGRFKVVDPRLKKDMRAEKNSMKRKSHSKGGKKNKGGGLKKGKTMANGKKIKTGHQRRK